MPDSLLPAKVYHYTTSKALIGVIADKVLWASSIYHMNDAAEFRYAQQLALDLLPELLAKHNYSTLYEALRHKVREDRSTTVYVSSFSTKENQLSQWRGYCDVGDGYCIGFPTDALLAMAKKQAYRFQECIYAVTVQEHMIRELIEQAKRDYQEFPHRNTQRHEAANHAAGIFISQFARLAPLLKHPSFREEHEWRLISPPTLPSSSKIHFREGRSMIVPYVEFKLTFRRSRLRLAEVIIGPTPNEFAALKAVETMLLEYKVDFAQAFLSKIPYRG